MANPVLDAARAKRTATQIEIDDLIKLAGDRPEEERSLTDDEAEKFEQLAASIGKLDEQITALDAEEVRKTKAAAAEAETATPDETRGTALDIGDGKVTVTASPMTYDRHAPTSYMRDMALIAASTKDPSYNARADQARERLLQHGKEIDVESRHNRDLAGRLQEIRMEQRAGFAPTDYEARINPVGNIAGSGGELIPPLWLESQYAPFLRAGRVIADRCNNMPLPPGINVINVPKLTLGSLTGIQTAQNAPVVSQDITTSSASANVNTIAGQEDISLQLLEQSPLNMDGVIFMDLSASYNQQLDIQVIRGSGVNGQHKGVLSVSQAASPSVSQASTVTCASTVFADNSTTGTQYRSLLNAVNQVETLTFGQVGPPSAIWVHPRRANSWAYSAVDSTYRPLFIPAKYGSVSNVYGRNEESPTAQGVAGELYGLPVVKDANMPTTMNSTTVTGGTADAIAVLIESQMWLWEGSLRLRALPEILSGTLQMRYQAYAYSAFMPDRLPNSISIITGNTGLAAPGF